jgi:preprotein translocase subunit SecE
METKYFNVLALWFSGIKPDRQDRIFSDPIGKLLAGKWKYQAMAAKSNPFTFFQQVRQEVAKVTWPTRRETVVTTIMVFIMIILAAIFFLSVDQVLSFVIGWLLSIGG